MIKRFITAAICLALIISFAITAIATEETFTITIDGQVMTLDVQPVRIDSSVDSDIYVPMLSFCEGMGAKVLKWDEESQSALAVFREFAIDATADDCYITANGRCLYAEYGCTVIDGVFMVQLSSICRALDAVYEIDFKNSTISIITGEGIITSGDEFYDSDDLLWLSRIIWAEAGNQSFLGKLAVGNVVMNRVNDSTGRFPDDIYGVIFQTNQFQPTDNGSIYNTPTESCIIAAKLALEGAAPVGNCLYFAALTECWAGYNRPYYGQIGGHYFWL